MGGSRGWRYAAAAFWIANGLNHFRAPKFYEAIVPPPLRAHHPGIRVDRDGPLGCYIQWGARVDGAGLRIWDVAPANVDD